ncbi:hypoxanthine phosphoribosyltransferase [Dysgonomonas sp. 216]|uniref:hypoxanthine phosphoribosyltransferase n=1 Tax=Dysgonomonas sp. 216 TaxID=2302934 RepID=UPI0013D18C4C|nr:hypoxanthine phosphoribosyltransferase [Dysgonomonas sp. 216]NDW18836.1 hypoxanthine phosphoribosyltransferase [Dysgonomonas sp. 216]
MEKYVKIKDKEFELFIDNNTISTAIKNIACKMDSDLAGQEPLFICILNGSFMFAAELMKNLNIPSEITFVRMASYSGTSSTGVLKEIYGLQENIEGRTVVIIEDIVDTGTTMSLVLEQLAGYNPKKILISTLLFKPDALIEKIEPDYVALEIPNDFIIGFGLDYDGYGRNYPDIYKITEK